MTAYVIHQGRCRDDRIRFMSGRGERRRRHRSYGRHGFGPRAGRGDIRAAILVLLGEQPMHGYQIIQELTERTGGVWRPSPGSVYPTLQQLEDEELVRETASESGKRVYELTDAGRELASATTPPWSAVAGESEDALVALARPRPPGARGHAAGRARRECGPARGGADRAPRRAPEPLPAARRRGVAVFARRRFGSRRMPPGAYGDVAQPQSSAATSATSRPASACASLRRARSLDERDRANARGHLRAHGRLRRRPPRGRRAGRPRRARARRPCRRTTSHRAGPLP